MNGWTAVLKDGTIYSEQDTKWKDVPKKNIKSLSLKHNGREWLLENKQAYFVSNRASMVPGNADSFVVEERGIGFYEGKNRVLYTVNEFTGEFKIKVL